MSAVGVLAAVFSFLIGCHFWCQCLIEIRCVWVGLNDWCKASYLFAGQVWPPVRPTGTESESPSLTQIFIRCPLPDRICHMTENGCQLMVIIFTNPVSASLNTYQTNKNIPVYKKTSSTPSLTMSVFLILVSWFSRRLISSVPDMIFAHLSKLIHTNWSYQPTTETLCFCVGGYRDYTPIHR